MFTGIIETTGSLQRRDNHGDDCTLTIASDTFDFSRCALGDSIAVNGVCLTAVALTAHSFSADVSHETLRLTTLGSLQSGDAANCSRAKPTHAANASPSPPPRRLRATSPPKAR